MFKPPRTGVPAPLWRMAAFEPREEKSMSSEAVEVALYDLGVKREARTGFASDPEAFLARYALTSEEAAMIRDFDVAGLQARKVSPLLTMGFWTMNHPSRSLRDYLAHLRACQ